MRRDIEGRRRTTLVLLLFAGCAESDPGPGFSGTGDSIVTSNGTAEHPSTGATSTTDTTSAVPATTGADTGGRPTTSTSGADGTSEFGGSDEAGSTHTGTSGEATPSFPSFAVDIYPVIDAHCSCHKDDSGAGMLRLRQEDAYTNLVDQPSDQLPEMMLVAPGATDTSYLWHKLNDNQKQVGGTGKRMPTGGILGMEDLALIQLWIDEGAKP